MRLTRRLRQRLRLAVTILATVAALGAVTAVPATAAPTPSPSAGAADPDGADPDSAGGSLQDQLTAATQAYVDAQGRLDQAQKQQADLTAKLAAGEKRLAELTAAAGTIASRAYRAGPASTLMTVFDTVSPDEFLDRAQTLQQLTEYDSRQLAELKALKETAATQQAQLDQAVAQAKTQTAELARRKAQIQQAVAVTSGGPTTGVVIPAPSAEPAPRNPDGSFPNEKCNQDDPTTTGCLTPRTLHALQQARLTGFTHYTACYRPATWGEHPLGRACDFAADPNGFGGIATGASRDYGNRLAGYFIANADRLGVLYVIWYHQVWTPAIGWHYYKGDGTPSGDHMNHVHLSER